MSTNIKAFILIFLFAIIISLQIYIIVNNVKERTISDKHEEGHERSGNRVKRDEERAKRSVIQNPFLDVMMKTSMFNYLPKNPFELFEILRDSYPLPGGLTSPFSEYDYVVIGAGSAGSVVASRLTEDKNVTVLVIEPGQPENFFTDVPGISPYFQRTDYTWPYFMEPQSGVCMGMINERCFWPRGRAVGGTSVINYMIYTRGRPQEWDRIAAAGNYGWSYKDVLKYYIRNERANLRGYEDSPYRGRKGKAYVEYVPTRTQLIDTFLEAGRILGHPTVDYNAPDRLGFGYVQSNMRYGHRHSVAKAFLHDNKRRQNLHILSSSTATKILIDPESRRAYGVEYIRNNIKYQVIARREVILSAGPIVSPQLLMLSGVGPKDHLNNLGISVIQDLPVGRTLYDHITYPGVIFKLNTTNVSVIESKTANIRNIIQYIQFGDTFVSTPGGVEGIGYVKIEDSEEPEGVPDIELICIGGSLVSDGGPQGSKAVRRGMSISEEVFDEAYGSIDNTDTWSAFPMLLHPKSKGYLELRDTSIFSQPKLYGNYLTDPRDVRTFIAGIRHIIALASTEPFQRLGARLHRAEFPACRQLQFNSDEYWECAIRTLTATLHHQIATCRMGPPDDPNAVVDPELRVYGIAGLRVVDTSIIPRTTSAHTHAPGMMIGEKASDLIKITWRGTDDHLARYYIDNKQNVYSNYVSEY